MKRTSEPPHCSKMQLFKLFCIVIGLGSLIARAEAQTRLGAQAPEGSPDRSQQWLVPSPDRITAAHALLFRPPGAGPFPLPIIPHAPPQNLLLPAHIRHPA